MRRDGRREAPGWVLSWLHNPPQGLTALAPPKRGFVCSFVFHLTSRRAAPLPTPRKLLVLVLALEEEAEDDEYEGEVSFSWIVEPITGMHPPSYSRNSSSVRDRSQRARRCITRLANRHSGF